MTHSGHEHHHGQDAPTNFGRAFLIAIIANGLFVLVQLFFAYLAHSTSLFADAIHNLGDVFSLIVAWTGNLLLKRQPTIRATYGLKKASILAALTNVVILIFTCGMIVHEALARFMNPVAIDTFDVMLVAILGVVVNAATAFLFWRGGKDLNIRAAFLHLVSDALVSVGVVATAFLIHLSGFLWLDPLAGLLIAAVILKGTWSIFKDSLRLILDGVPSYISVASVHELLSRQPGVKGIHDLHIWAISTQENALSVHLWMPDGPLTDDARQRLSEELLSTHHIHHTTFQIEQAAECCQDKCKIYL